MSLPCARRECHHGRVLWFDRCTLHARVYCHYACCISRENPTFYFVLPPESIGYSPLVHSSASNSCSVLVGGGSAQQTDDEKEQEERTFNILHMYMIPTREQSPEEHADRDTATERFRPFVVPLQVAHLPSMRLRMCSM